MFLYDENDKDFPSYWEQVFANYSTNYDKLFVENEKCNLFDFKCFLYVDLLPNCADLILIDFGLVWQMSLVCGKSKQLIV